MFCTCRKSSKYKFNILWFDPAWTQTHDLPLTNYYITGVVWMSILYLRTWSFQQILQCTMGKYTLLCQRLSFWYKLQSSLHMSLIHFRVRPPLEIWNLYLPFCAFLEQVCFYSLNSRVGFFLSYFFCKTYSVLIIWSKFHLSTTIFYEMEKKYLNRKEFIRNVRKYQSVYPETVSKRKVQQGKQWSNTAKKTKIEQHKAH